MNGVAHSYILDGTRILRETWGDNVLIPLYDNEESVCGITYNGTAYYFLKNLQGDIIAITDQNGQTVAKYTYDAWGACTISQDTTDIGIATVNPFRYRGYYFDTETNLYYLQSRYYDPIVGRFINADEAILLAFRNDKFKTNLFTSCDNKPVCQQDENGYIAANIIGAAIGAIIGVVGGVFLGNWLADVLKLSGWKRCVFVCAVSALVGAAAGAIGYFIGPYVAKIALKLGKYVANLVKKGKIVFKNLSSSVKSSLRTLFKETCCFIADTKIYTPTGEIPIESISVGDMVYSSNPETGEVKPKRVVNIFRKQTYVLYHIITNEDEIVTTAEHPFWINNKGWVAAQDLTQGDILYSHDKQLASISNVFIEHLDNPVVVYNFEVEDWHTYFVGSQMILVHNKCSLTKMSQSLLKNNKHIDPHSIKYEVLGKTAQISRYDLYYEKSTGAIFILAKGAEAGAKIATGYFIK